MKKTNEKFQEILEALSHFPDGASLEEVKSTSGMTTSEKTIYRYLMAMVKEELIKIEGKGRSTKYKLIDNATRSAEIIISDNSERLLEYLEVPLDERPPRKYEAGFLTDYRPNINFLLSSADRMHLARLGTTSIPNQPAGTYAKEVLHRLLIDLSWNSSRLEGNTYSLLDTERLLSVGQLADDKSTLEAQMILNHKDAIEFLVQSGDDIGLNRYTITNLHAMLSNNLLPDPAASGRLRTFGVGIHQSAYTPLSLPQQIEEMFEILLKKASEIKDPFEQTFFIMVHLPYLQPFDDVNKRVSRLAANIPLNKNNLAPLSFIDVPNDLYIKGMLGVYELNDVSLLKDVFLWAYERSAIRYATVRQSLGEPDPFRLKYRDVIKEIVSNIIRDALSKVLADNAIKRKAEELPEIDRAKFIEAVETELLSLHDGNFARYWVRPSEFHRWMEVWKSE